MTSIKLIKQMSAAVSICVFTDGLLITLYFPSSQLKQHYLFFSLCGFHLLQFLTSTGTEQGANFEIVHHPAISWHK